MKKLMFLLIFLTVVFPLSASAQSPTGKVSCPSCGKWPDSMRYEYSRDLRSYRVPGWGVTPAYTWIPCGHTMSPWTRVTYRSYNPWTGRGVGGAGWSGRYSGAWGAQSHLQEWRGRW